MRIRRKLAAAFASGALAVTLLAGCTTGTESTGTQSTTTQSTGTGSATTATAVAVSAVQSAAEVLAANEADHAEADAAAYEPSEVVDIALGGDSAEATGDGVTVDGSTVTITAAGSYRLSGTLTDGRVVVDAPGATVRLILDGARISSSSTAAIAAVEAERLVVVLADGSRNTLSDASSYADGAEADAALFSAGDLTVTGGGALDVHGNGNDAIAGKDGLVIQSGTVTVVEAADDGIRGKDYVVIDGGKVTVTSGGDGIKADNTEDADAGYVSVTGGGVTVTAGGDGVDAATDLVVTGGTLDVTAGGGSGVTPAGETSAKGLKAGVITVLEGGAAGIDASDDAVHSDGAVRLAGTGLTAATGGDAVHAEGALVIDGGTVDITRSAEGLEGADIVLNSGNVTVVASDDGINAAGGTTGTAEAQGGPGGGEPAGDHSVTVTGGTLVIDSAGDGFDSNGTAAISGGTVVVNGPTQSMNGALDVDGSFQISGGVLLASGSAGMVVAPDTGSAQGWVSVTLDTAAQAGTTLQLVDDGGALVATYVTPKTIQNLVFSSADITSGKEYAVHTGGTASGTSTGGLAASGELGSATQVATATAGQAPAGGGRGGPGGPPMGERPDAASARSDQ
ncbi:carbohydrate-binding domain-containing protein [Planomonospora venezuelensis]|uniref:Carbohydrate-binding domain-containing protein n=1 Tax=Planomonospora venezuelensis TaxID=1999 RepID=A0A841DHI2_PLAVE|nr:carbohydrate-binding domain-containing protein [Planomonospora venezuelensis]MBB5967768.1 hypothetical protein [Planomonospora venezuelensis]GIM62297.1 hypothetical protein Pve01_75320 [Planomonospora venezuelensis]